MMMKPSDIGSVPSDQLPTVSVTPEAEMLPVRGSPLSGSEPSPISTLAVPVRFIVLPFTVAVVIQPVIVTCWKRPMTGLMPLN